jgi:hypothetical protein
VKIPCREARVRFPESEDSLQWTLARAADLAFFGRECNFKRLRLSAVFARELAVTESVSCTYVNGFDCLMLRSFADIPQDINLYLLTYVDPRRHDTTP